MQWPRWRSWASRGAASSERSSRIVAGPPVASSRTGVGRCTCCTCSGRHQSASNLRSRLPSPARTHARVYSHPAGQPHLSSHTHRPTKNPQALAQSPDYSRVPSSRTWRNPSCLSIERIRTKSHSPIRIPFARARDHPPRARRRRVCRVARASRSRGLSGSGGPSR